MEGRRITSKPSPTTYALALGLILMGLALTAVCLWAWFQGVEPRWSVVLFGLLGLYTAALGVDEGWLSGLEVTPTTLRVRSFGRWSEYTLKGLDAADGLRDILGGGWQVVLLGQGREAIRVPLRRYANAQQLAQALLDALWMQNKDLVVMPRLAHRFGRPPFGLLTRKRS
ncbi:MAG: amino acid ABC transporter permease [Meiothermus sp.]|uniref:amino acid ABC transporter permease n=1 Tax=Meiothermus sp. TaxID=1955249 RepID=UPI0025F3EC61|nr:amino acid ABC transporter permease [Meiothermus sp.]MCS7057513.1 amino acid ABC transporter permease [Meiothermus sp.]MCS7193702.1 amino acid ABC transporter permease [Meiothermus sp.]MCX7740089.1 amino acid ABC transporter permease [Meiothermus sp.]MDW8089943.1 amino acid ABC transporter permease [Meiothermus sp.]MDW8481632.1 amino acid ABC transporter permease [Meiothermus sp.]